MDTVIADAYQLAIKQARLDVTCARHARGPNGEHLTARELKVGVELAQERLNAIIDAINIGRHEI